MSQFNEEMNKKAVALSYDEDMNSAPVIVASGMGHMAEKIVEIARESGVPVYEDNSLATMLTQLELGSEIPEQLYQAIVDIYVYFLNFASKGVKEPAAQEMQNAQTPPAQSIPAEPQVQQDATQHTPSRENPNAGKTGFSVQQIMESE